jgi:hypothetical protein
MRRIINQQKIYFCFKIVTIILAIPLFSYSQDINLGSINNLKASNGFGNIYLGENISLIPKYKLAFMDNDSIPDIDGCIKYEYRDLDKINNDNNLDLDLVGIRVYKNKIINIYLFFRKEDGYKIFQSFESNYGGYSQRLGDFTYNWDADNVKLCLEYDKEDLGIAIYSCKKLYQEIDRNKSQQLAAQ